jgi:NAD(P)H-hydrate repair Nnr-like enzyme with NAD(P)H-hydrate epimerase domain
MKLLTAAQIREADAYTVKEEGISSTDLMERAAKALQVGSRISLPHQKLYTFFVARATTVEMDL